jgi:excisionase family DNA binding protein
MARGFTRTFSQKSASNLLTKLFFVYNLCLIMGDQGLTITQAADALKVSPKTIRRYIKDGKIPYVLIPGKFGQEYRIPLSLPDIINKETAQAALGVAFGQGLGNSAEPSSTSAQEAQGVDKPAPDNTSTTDIAPAMNIISDLQKTNMQLAAQLGAAQERIRELESQLRLIATRKEPWWRRVLKTVGI